MQYAITCFQEDGKHIPLSNFYPSPIVMHDGEYATVEHFYQAMKSVDTDERELIRRASSPGKAKRLGRTCMMRRDWDEMKLLIMRGALAAKFTAAGGECTEYLLATGEKFLIEGNTWGDTYWGESPVGTGANWLGHLLMARRAELRWGLEADNRSLFDNV